MTDQILYILWENFLSLKINKHDTYLMEYMIFPSSGVIIHSSVAASTGVGNRISEWIIVIIIFKKKILLIFNVW